MFSLGDIEKPVLHRLGERLREQRIQRGERQAVFAARLGVSVPTCRKMERGDPTVQIGYWVRALHLLGRLGDLEDLLKASGSLFEQWDKNQVSPSPAKRRRVRRK